MKPEICEINTEEVFKALEKLKTQMQNIINVSVPNKIQNKAALVIISEYFLKTKNEITGISFHGRAYLFPYFDK